MLKSRLWISTVIGLLAVALVIWLSPAPNYKARGILLPAKQTQSAIAAQSVTALLPPPTAGKVMGYINIERHYAMDEGWARQEIHQLAQKLAAQVGANAFVVNFFGVGQVTSTQSIYIFRATAYSMPSIPSSMEPSLR